MKKLFALIVFLLPLSVSSSAAGDDPYAADRQALLLVFREVEAGINAQDIERMVAQMSPQATVTWLDGEVSRGHDEIRAYYRRMVNGEQRILDRYLTSAKVGASARFFADGQIAVADGTMEDEFFPVARGPFKLSSHWSSTSAKIDGQWKVVSLHLSANVFTNSLMTEAKNALWYAGSVGLMIGGLIGILIGRIQQQRQR
ncbi:MAG TPA: nuclear transport factor 2 family protein [Accumulibacter sp.]|nr:nuclear transport factor 2 family protein [Accumulibacter sp.]HPP47008.1 nuclear transport factor 2 family protein [Accumulibacter sp.]